MYCRKCGSEVKANSKFCAKCGEKVNSDVHKNTVANTNKKNRTFLIGIVAVIAIILVVIWIVSSRKTEIEKMVGTWEEESGNLTLTIYEPDNEEKNMGRTEIFENEEIIYGSYKWEENSKCITLSGADNWGDTVDVSYKYEFEQADEIVLTAIENPEMVLYLKKEK